MAEPLRDYLDFAIETAWQAGKLTLGYYQQREMETEIKPDESPVTAADRLAEELVRERISRKYPDHAIVGEEYGAGESDDATHRWFIDPIDGTRSFVRGIPLYAVLLGLEINGKCEVGVAFYPVLKEMLAAATGEGCRWNGRPAKVSEAATLREGILTHANAAAFETVGRGEAFIRLQRAAGYCAGWADAYAYLLVATGRAEVALDPIMSPWDCSPFPPIFREAGGYFGDWDGKETIYAQEALATTRKLLPEVLGLITGETE
jgi:myo-inositol-1(or 4)-monophosphatase